MGSYSPPGGSVPANIVCTTVTASGAIQADSLATTTSVAAGTSNQGQTGNFSQSLIAGSAGGSGTFRHRGDQLSFYNAVTVAKQTVSGSKGANAALTSLMTALAALGLVTDSTS